MQCEIQHNHLACMYVCRVSKRNVIKIFDDSRVSLSDSSGSSTFALYEYVLTKISKSLQRSAGKKTKNKNKQKNNEISFKWKTC